MELPAMDNAEPVILLAEEPASPNRPHPGFWGAVLWCVGMLVITQLLPSFLAGIIFAAIHAPQQPSHRTPASELVRSQDFADAMLPGLAFGSVASLAIALLAVRLIVGKDWPRIIALRMPSGLHLTLALVGLPALMVVESGIDDVAKRILPSVLDYEGMFAVFGKWPWPMGVAVIGLLPGIAEEFWFRGFFGRGLVGRYGVVAGVLLSSVLFGAMHIEPRQAAYAMFLGICLHLAYLASRSLVVPMLLHMLNNSISVLVPHVVALQFLNKPTATIPWYCYPAAVLSLAAVAWAFFATRCRIATAAEAGRLAWQPTFPGVECPPPGSAGRVLRPAMGLANWSFVALSTVLLAAALTCGIRAMKSQAAPVPIAARVTASPTTAPAAGPLPASSTYEILALLRREPMSAATWPAWSLRLRSWLGDSSDTTDAAFGNARIFLQHQYANSTFPPPMRDDAIAWYVYGRAQVRSIDDPRNATDRGRFAESLLRRSIELDSSIGRAHYALAIALFLQTAPNASHDAKYAEAVAAARLGERLDRTVPAKMAEGWAAMLQKRYADAERLFGETIKERPDVSSTYHSLAMAIVWNENRPGKYAPAVEPLVEHCPRYGDAVCLFAVALWRDHRPHSAARELDRARQHGVDPARSLPRKWVHMIERDRGRPDSKD